MKLRHAGITVPKQQLVEFLYYLTSYSIKFCDSNLRVSHVQPSIISRDLRKPYISGGIRYPFQQQRFCSRIVQLLAASAGFVHFHWQCYKSINSCFQLCVHIVVELWCRRKAGRALKKLNLPRFPPRVTLTLLSCCPNFLRVPQLASAHKSANQVIKRDCVTAEL